MSTTRTITITCDGKTSAPNPVCARKLTAQSEKPGEANTKARNAGWYIGVNDTAYCPDHAAALGLKTKRTA